MSRLPRLPRLPADDRQLAEEVIAHIEHDGAVAATGRREFLVGAAATVAAAGTLLHAGEAHAIAGPVSLAATPPAGFTPFAAPGRVIKVTKADCMQANKMYPKEDDAK